MKTTTEPTLRPPSQTVDPSDAPVVVPLQSVGRSDVALVGGNGANLGELLRHGSPVPGGFVVTTAAYLDTVERSGQRRRLAALSRDASTASRSELEAIAAHARDLVASCDVGDDLVAAISEQYATSCWGARVAVRASVPVEDTAGTPTAGTLSAGTYESFTNVDAESLMERIVDCWVSLYDDRVVADRAERGLVDEPRIAVVVQPMVASDRSGVMLTSDPARRDQVMIEATFGVGEAGAGSHVEPDTYHVDRETVGIREIRVGRKALHTGTGEAGADRQDVETAEVGRAAWRRVLTDDEIRRVAAIGLDIERHAGVGQDIEFAFVGPELVILQSRPITVDAAHRTIAAETRLLLDAARRIGAVRSTHDRPTHLVAAQRAATQPGLSGREGPVR